MRNAVPPCVRYAVVLLAAIVFIGITSRAGAQDAQFSHPLSAPQWLNPALAGSENFLRGSVAYRTQWNAVADPFRTMSGSFDMATGQKNNLRRERSGKGGVGISFLSDKGGNLNFNTSEIMIHGAYHVQLNQTSQLGAGVYTGYSSQSVDAETGKWASQYNGQFYDSAISHGEDIAGLKQSSLDLGAGLVYVYQEHSNSRTRSKINSLKVGVAGYHLGNLKLGPEVLSSDKLPIRLSAFAQAAVEVGKSGSAIEPAVYYQRQGSFQMVMSGLAFRKKFLAGGGLSRDKKVVSVALGGYYRANDAIVAMIAAEWAGFNVSLLYDINISSLNKFSSGKGAVEVALQYSIVKPTFRH